MKFHSMIGLLAALSVAGAVSAETKTFRPGARDNAVRVTICPHDDAGFRIDVLRRGRRRRSEAWGPCGRSRRDSRCRRSTDACIRVAVGAFAGGPITLLGDTYVTFDGWRTIVIPPPREWLSPAKKGQKVRIGSLLFGTGRKTLNPVEMVDVTGDLRFGGLFTCRNVTPETPLTDAERRAAEIMKTVDDKDL